MSDLISDYPLLVAILVLLLMFVYLGLGIWVFAALTLVGLTGMVVFLDMPIDRVGVIVKGTMWRTANTWELAAIPIVLTARWISVSIPIGLVAIRERFTQGAIRLLTWGGLRGGISVALALSLPETPYKSEILTTTYAVVLFSIIVQGLSIRHVVKRVVR